jgi:hypothetical protein
LGRSLRLTYEVSHQRLRSSSGLLFTEIDGTPLHPDSFTRRFRRLVAKVEWEQVGARRVGLPKIRLHDMRHT